MGNRLGELPKIVEVAAADLIDDVPIDGLIAMNGNVSESDRNVSTTLRHLPWEFSVQPPLSAS